MLTWTYISVLDI